MKDAARLLCYLGGVVLLGALAGPPLFWFGLFLSTHGMFSSLARFDFESYFHRALLLAAIVLLWPLLRALRIRGWRDLGLAKNDRAAVDVTAGFAIAAIPLLCCGAGLIAAHVYSVRHAFLWHKVPTVLVATIFVPIVEEIFFRGLILGVLLRSGLRLAAIVFVAAFFSIIHFLQPSGLTMPNESINWSSGFVVIAHAFSQFSQPLLVAGGFTTLFIVGCVLADARLLTRSLWLPIGLHSGWIFASGMFSKTAHRELLALPWIGKDLLAGLLPLSIALLSWALMRAWVKHARSLSSQSSRRPP